MNEWNSKEKNNKMNRKTGALGILEFFAEENEKSLKRMTHPGVISAYILMFFSLMLMLCGMRYGFGPVLWILAFVVTFGALIVGVFLIIRSYFSGDQETQTVADEIEALANDASFDVSEQIIYWDKLQYTKGVGTQLEGRDEEISEIHRQLVNAREEIAAAETSQHRLEAVLTADSILTTARLLDKKA